MQNNLKQRSRTKNAMLNGATSSGVFAINMIIKFFTRAIFVKFFVLDYIGLQSTLGTLIATLSIADLGIGGAIGYIEGRALHQKKYGQVKVVNNLFRKWSSIIGVLIAIIGVGILPFLPFIFSNTSIPIEELRVYYLVYLATTVASYFFKGKRNVLGSDQRAYIYHGLQAVFQTATTILQVIVILKTQNYLLFLLCALLSTLIVDIILYFISNHMYKFIDEAPDEPIEKDSIDLMKKNIFASMLVNIVAKVSSAFSSVVLAKVIGLARVGAWENYALIINAATSMLGEMLSHVGVNFVHLAANETEEHVYTVYKRYTFIQVAASLILCTGLFTCINQFIRIWLGGEFVLSGSLTAIVLAGIATGAINSGISMVTGAYGQNYRFKWISISSMFIGIALTYFFVITLNLGLMGSMLSGLVNGLIFYWYTPLILYKHILHQPYIEWVKQVFIYGSAITFSCFASFGITKLIPEDWNDYLKFGLFVLVSLAVSFGTLLMFWKTDEFKYTVSLIKRTFRWGKNKSIYVKDKTKDKAHHIGQKGKGTVKKAGQKVKKTASLAKDKIGNHEKDQ